MWTHMTAKHGSFFQLQVSVDLPLETKVIHSRMTALESIRYLYQCNSIILPFTWTRRNERVNNFRHVQWQLNITRCCSCKNTILGRKISGLTTFFLDIFHITFQFCFHFCSFTPISQLDVWMSIHIWIGADAIPFVLTQSVVVCNGSTMQFTLSSSFLWFILPMTLHWSSLLICYVQSRSIFYIMNANKERNRFNMQFVVSFSFRLKFNYLFNGSIRFHSLHLQPQLTIDFHKTFFCISSTSYLCTCCGFKTTESAIAVHTPAQSISSFVQPFIQIIDFHSTNNELASSV